MANYRQVILNDRPVAYWRLGELSGVSAVDETGNGNTGTYNGGVTLGQAGALAPDTPPNTAALFDGANDFVSVVSTAVLRVADIFSFECWYKLTIPPGQYQFYSAPNTGLRIKIANDNNVYVIVAGANSIVSSGGVPVDGNWHHLVVTKSGATQAIYIDGVARPATITNQTFPSATGTHYIGALNGSSEFLNGALDEVAVYDLALSASQVNSHYLAGITRQAVGHKPPDFHIYVRDNATLAIEAEIPTPTFAELFPRFNDVGRWRMVVPFSGKAADILTKGKGIVVERNGETIFSGSVHYRRRRLAFNDSAEWDKFVEIAGPDDNFYLAARLASPVPSGPPYTAASYDVRTGITSTIMRQYVDFNVGPSATAARQKTGLTLAADPVLGISQTGRARFQPLIELLRSLAASGGDLGFRALQDAASSQITFTIFQPSDLTDSAAFSVLAGTLRELDLLQEGGQGNYVIVAGSGEGTARVFHEEGNSTAILDYERIEFFRDRRDTSVTAELEQTADEELARNAERFNLNIIPVDAGSLVYPSGYNLGTKVAVEIVKEPSDGYFELDFTYEDIVREIHIQITEEGELIRPIVGTPESRSIAFQEWERKLERRVSELERR